MFGIIQKIIAFQFSEFVVVCTLCKINALCLQNYAGEAEDMTKQLADDQNEYILWRINIEECNAKLHITDSDVSIVKMDQIDNNNAKTVEGDNYYLVTTKWEHVNGLKIVYDNVCATEAFSA